MKLMKHPLHGWHHAYTPHEEDAMRLNGWVDDVPAAVAVPEPATPSPTFSGVLTMPTAPRRPGRPRKVI